MNYSAGIFNVFRSVIAACVYQCLWLLRISVFVIAVNVSVCDCCVYSDLFSMPCRMVCPDCVCGKSFSVRLGALKCWVLYWWIVILMSYCYHYYIDELLLIYWWTIVIILINYCYSEELLLLYWWIVIVLMNYKYIVIDGLLLYCYYIDELLCCYCIDELLLYCWIIVI